MLPLGSVEILMWCLFIGLRSPSVHPSLLVSSLGADSNSECSSGSGVLPLDSRETSPAASSARDDEPDRGFGGRSSGGASFQEPDRERAGGQQQAGREERPHGDWDEKGPAPHQWLGAVVGEE